MAARSAYTRGTETRVKHFESSSTALQQALNAYENDKLAATSSSVYASHLASWSSRALARGFEAFPLTVATMKVMGVLLKAGEYRSAEQFFTVCKREHVLQGYTWDDALQREMADGIRSSTRGMGPPKQCPALDLYSVSSLTDACFDLGPIGEGPMRPRDCLLVDSWWALREIEASLISLSQISFRSGGGACEKTCTLDLPVSKTDVRAWQEAHAWLLLS